MPEPVRQRAAVVLIDDRSVALIERRLAGRVYYLFPGGGVDEAESLEDAAIREAEEELGLRVDLGELLAVVRFEESQQYYFRAAVTGGSFGTGTGIELGSPEESETGSYRPVWVSVDRLDELDVRPRGLVDLLLGRSAPLAAPVVIDDAG